MCVATSPLDTNKPQLVWRNYDQIPPNSTSTSHSDSSAISTISAHPSQVQLSHHQQGDSNSESSTSPISEIVISPDAGANGINRQFTSSGSEATSGIITALNVPSPSVQQTQNLMATTGSIVIKTEDNDDSPMREVDGLVPEIDTTKFVFSKDSRF